VIEDYFGDGSSLGVEIVYLREDEALGTAGALSLLSSCEGILDKPFVVTNGDIITDLNYRALLDFHMAEQSSATMAVRIHSYQNPFGVVETAGLNFKEVREKPTTHSYINAGVYVLDPSVLGLIPPKNVVDMTDLFNMAARVPDKNVMVYPMKELWMDVGNLQDLAQARSFFEREYCD
jgi:NDP-sugar pyrophosphorylase family protein